MMVIGLTGKAAAGKNVVADAFSTLGCEVVDVDLLGHSVLEQNQDLLQKSFGKDIVREGRVDRRALGSLVFSDPEKLHLLEAITHPAMVEACKRLIEEAKSAQKPALVINAALLYRMGLYTLCDHVVFVKAPCLVRFLRSRKREHITLAKFLSRERAQQDVRKEVFPSSLPVFSLSNGSDRVLIHRQVTTYCATIGIGVSSVR
ncbi:dephospho-CoA kinase [Sphaerochaeta sp. PS]|uniref:dephospho-CoA kinase n=1 Tax=Sphaerochaeta sp. PS TaxID=3076336 RepID=UPI0028A561C9|nr:dephospho-CoA kinase [Sphaerochaeta sp. PS]MDT4761904.1 dephospho-CoA kinase [Sphaerochaeta sp. PS]